MFGNHCLGDVIITKTLTVGQWWHWTENAYREVLRRAYKVADVVKLTCDNIPGKSNKPFMFWCVRHEWHWTRLCETWAIGPLGHWAIAWSVFFPDTLNQHV